MTGNADVSYELNELNINIFYHILNQSLMKIKCFYKFFLDNTEVVTQRCS